MYYAQNINANESFPIIDSEYRLVTDYKVAESIFLENFDQDIYILIN